MGRGRELVLLHGWGMNAAVLEPFARLLANDFRITLIELPGHGGSDYAAALNSLDDWSHALMQAAPEKAAWLGWSLGGQLAMNIASLAPERVSALIMLASTPKFVQDNDWFCALPAAVLHQFSEQLLDNPAATLNRFLALQVHGVEHEREMLKQLRQVMRHTQPPRTEALENGLQLLLDTDLRSVMQDLQLPSLWLLGARDTLVPAELGSELHKLLPEAEVQLLEKAAHAPFVSHTELCGKLIREFLDAN